MNVLPLDHNNNINNDNQEHADNNSPPDLLPQPRQQREERLPSGRVEPMPRVNFPMSERPEPEDPRAGWRRLRISGNPSEELRILRARCFELEEELLQVQERLQIAERAIEEQERLSRERQERPGDLALANQMRLALRAVGQEHPELARHMASALLVGLS